MTPNNSFKVFNNAPMNQIPCKLPLPDFNALYPPSHDQPAQYGIENNPGFEIF